MLSVRSPTARNGGRRGEPVRQKIHHFPATPTPPRVRARASTYLRVLRGSRVSARGGQSAGTPRDPSRGAERAYPCVPTLLVRRRRAQSARIDHRKPTSIRSARIHTRHSPPSARPPSTHSAAPHKPHALRVDRQAAQSARVFPSNSTRFARSTRAQARRSPPFASENSPAFRELHALRVGSLAAQSPRPHRIPRTPHAPFQPKLRANPSSAQNAHSVVSPRSRAHASLGSARVGPPLDQTSLEERASSDSPSPPSVRAD